MAPTYIKGGIWTNVEDEILRAAISKYGLNQWARVSSLLARKTAKQAKARWTEWLDPAIKKTEWTRDEDEKLLHLAKIMPTRWRSIAEIVGRTAAQCIERYQKLLDDAEASELGLTGDNEASGAGVGPASREIRVGDIDAAPETRPARPDQVDMDEEEKEMLSEARARLANTQGKKAKRKARERLLAESRRLTLLQKRRELKQAGINTKLRVKNKGSIDYNADIPFEHKPAPGFYDTRDESAENEKARIEWQRAMEAKGFDVKDKKESKGKADGKKRTAEQRASAAEQAAQARAERLAQLDTAEQLAKRRKLVLPEPQVRDDELEHVAKQARRAGREVADEGEAEFSAAPQVDEEDDARERVRRGLAALPKPKNDFEIVVDEEEPEPATVEDELPEDSGARDRRLAAEREARLQREFLKLSKVLQLGLPRPQNSDIDADDDISVEMRRLIEADNREYPLDSDIKALLAKRGASSDVSPYDRARVEDMIAEELANANQTPIDVPETTLRDDETTRAELLARLRRFAEASNKQEKKLGLVLGGYTKRQAFLSSKLSEALEALHRAEIERDTFARLAEMEQLAASTRASHLQEEVNALVDAERRGQEQYRDLTSVRSELANGVSSA